MKNTKTIVMESCSLRKALSEMVTPARKKDAPNARMSLVLIIVRFDGRMIMAAPMSDTGTAISLINEYFSLNMNADSMNAQTTLN